LKNNKGFTLIELMIAIAIIGILALVLIPKVAGLKDNARTAGLDTNMRVALSLAEGMVDSYTADDAGARALETALATKIGLQGIQNPFTKANTVANAVPAAGNCAFAYTAAAATQEPSDDATGSTGLAPGTATFPADALGNYKGVIYFDAFVSGGVLKVAFVPCGADGLPVAGKAKSTN
jgi:type IV pilus assembly protein PilA